MTPAPDDDRGFSTPLVLRDGSAATLRLMRPDDKERLVAAFAKLEQRSIYVRFFSHRKQIPESALRRIDEIDFVRLLGLVVTVGTGAEEIIVASCTYVASAGTAEVAFTIVDAYQGQGLGGRLLAAAAGIARRHGIARFTADVLAGNRPMLKVFERSGLPMRRRSEGGVIHVELDLTREQHHG